MKQIFSLVAVFQENKVNRITVGTQFFLNPEIEKKQKGTGNKKSLLNTFGCGQTECN